MKNKNESKDGGDLTPAVIQFSQHFLTNEKILEKMVFSSDIEPTDIVLEIGPGKGALTERLAEVAKKVIAVEMDERLEPYLDVVTQKYDNVEVVWRNILTLRFPKIDRVVSNLPFNITEPFISRLFNERFKTATLLVGETYGKQAASDNPYTRLGLLTRAYFLVDYIQDVPSEVFDPAPSTDGSIIKLSSVKKKDMTRDFRSYIIRCLWDQKTRPLRDALPAAIEQYIVDRGGTNVATGSIVNQIKAKYVHSLSDRVDKLQSSDLADLYDALNGISVKKIFSGHKPRGGSRNWRSTYESIL